MKNLNEFSMVVVDSHYMPAWGAPGGYGKNAPKRKPGFTKFEAPPDNLVRKPREQELREIALFVFLKKYEAKAKGIKDWGSWVLPQGEYGDEGFGEFPRE